MRAISLVGTPYRYGGNTPEGGFDCSGLVNYVYRDMLDLRLPRTSRDLFAMPHAPIAPDRLAGGDLVFFGSGGSVSHVGIYVGEGRFVHAPSSGGTVRLDRLDGAWWREHYTGARTIAELIQALAYVAAFTKMNSEKCNFVTGHRIHLRSPNDI